MDEVVKKSGETSVKTLKEMEKMEEEWRQKNQL